MRLALLLIACGTTLAAQDRDARMIRGTITDTVGTPIAYANVQTSGQGRTVTNDSGGFSYRAQIKGELQLRITRIGYEPQMLKLNPSGDTSISVKMTPIPRTLEAVGVEVARMNNRLKAHGFYDRMSDRQKGIGSATFITREDIEARNPMRITQMLDVVRGLRIVRKAQVPWGGGRGSSNDPGTGTAQLPTSSDEDWVILGPGSCQYTVYLDGAMISPRRNVRTRANEPFPIDPYLSPNGTAGIEVYPRGPGVPAQYSLMGETCGVVVFWSK
jgi:hypothetical protein